MRKMATIIFALLILNFFPLFALSQQPHPDTKPVTSVMEPVEDDCWSAGAGALNDVRFDPIREKMRQKIVGGAAPSFAIAVAVEGKVVWQAACGWADRERLLRATPDTVYPVASISKTFTATGLMVLVERGMVDLSRPANDYLGRAKLTAFVGDAQAATVRLVMQHRAGLPLHSQFFYEGQEPRRPTMDETIRRYGIIVRTPGEAFNYANLDYGIIEQIIAHTSGSSYEDFMHKEVFVPLGLNHTAAGPAPELRAATAALYAGDGKRLPYIDLDQRGAGIIYASINDLLRFGMFHLKEHLPQQRRILKDSTIDSMVTDAADQGDPTAAYGLGWAVIFNKFGAGVTEIRHSGAMPGASTVLRLVPSKRIAVAVLSNSFNGTNFELSEDIFAALLPEYAAQRAKRQATPQPPGTPTPFKPPAELVGTWHGILKTWSSEMAVRMDVRPDGDIHIKLGDQLETLVNNARFSNNEFGGRFSGTIPTEDANRERHIIALNRLVLRGDTLSGAAIAVADNYSLPSWIKLVRQNINR
jgi:CubicO group peptidase (beta-lactamase class C family)